jgi:hypothetical protein
MATWQEFSEQASELAERVRERFEAHKHLTIATIRADGGPRISGTEVPIRLGHVWLAGMTRARRFSDLRRDPRVAIHSASEDPEVWRGDAKISGLAVEVTDPDEIAEFTGTLEQSPGAFELFRVELAEAVSVRLTEERDALIIESWREGEPVRVVKR